MAAKDLVTLFLKSHPTQRIGCESFLALKDHGFFSGVNWAKIEDKDMMIPEGLVPVFAENEELGAKFGLIPDDHQKYPQLPEHVDHEIFDKF